MSEVVPDPAVPVVLLDRDGVINVDLPTGVLRIDAFEIMPQAVLAIVQLVQAGYRVAVITNQACVGRGEVTIDEVQMMHQELRSIVRGAGGDIHAFYVCPDPDNSSPLRKPNPGMLLQAQEDFGFDPAQTWFVGDAERDVEAARRAGCRPALVRTGKGEKSAAALPEVPVFDDLSAFVADLLESAHGHA